jgi:SAM-dependent methyltransferase
MKKEYLTKGFYKERDSSLRSAEIIVPVVLELFNPKSIVDFGCGTGEFLKVFLERGIKKILGIDGPWLNKKELRIPEKYFKGQDLRRKINFQEKFDLAISLEVGEHLPEKSSRELVEALVTASKVILFSSAIPLQRGEGHINEQWPEYWVKRFKDKNYVPIDIIRKKIWKNKEVSPWYAQNILLFVEKKLLIKEKKLKEAFEQTNQEMLSVIHPGVYLPKARIYNRLKNKVPFFLQKIFSKISPNI